jgi:hypothetical protein
LFTEVTMSVATGNRHQMAEFVATFPSLARAAGVGLTFDPPTFAKWATSGKSNAERQAAAFVLSVWNGGTPADGGWWNQRPYRVGRFDAVAAFALWDYQHKAAFLAWCADPFWP